MSTFSYNETKEYIQEQTMSVKFRHLLLLFYKISIPIYILFHLLANSFARLPRLPHQSRSGDASGDFSRARTSGSLREPNTDSRVERRAVSRRFVFLCTRKQTGNPTGTNFSITQNLHHLLDRMAPHSKLHCNFSNCSFGLL
jgi:hypothetical protein